MRVPSGILSVLKHHAGEPAPGDENIQVPAFALPTLEIPGGLTESLTAGLVQSNPRAESFITSFFQTRTGLGADQQNLAALRPGLWRLHVQLYICITNATPGVTGVDIVLRVPAAGPAVTPILSLHPQGANTGISETFQGNFSFERDSLIVINTAAIGAETMFFQVNLYAARLL